LSTQCLATLELLTFQTSQRVKDSREQEDYSCSDQAGRLGPDADPLHSTHHKVYGSAHVIGAELPDESVECGGRRADAEEERYFDEDDDE
jgi:hypothetical protein